MVAFSSCPAAANANGATGTTLSFTAWGSFTARMAAPCTLAWGRGARYVHEPEDKAPPSTTVVFGHDLARCPGNQQL
ncbi:hypothetical protein E2562_006873 [Oryza meyeriana var. granulata]|uniref:Uncharacterized protein n=1 Tax=Oryza meyeriana var. granulata TaxID=110450 RepID=A0A6G1C4S8_9ORYZ|nr:hypothetical protein E2562_006873 [Oryza meyeriana var. granulata]